MVSFAEDLDQITRRTRLSPVVRKNPQPFLFSDRTSPSNHLESWVTGALPVAVRDEDHHPFGATHHDRPARCSPRLALGRLDRRDQTQRRHEAGRRQHVQCLLLRVVPLHMAIRHAQQHRHHTSGACSPADRTSAAIDVHQVPPPPPPTGLFPVDGANARTDHRQCLSAVPDQPPAKCPINRRRSAPAVLRSAQQWQQHRGAGRPRSRPADTVGHLAVGADHHHHPPSGLCRRQVADHVVRENSLR